jgi:nucleoside triphosphate pyrophosphatase
MSGDPILYLASTSPRRRQLLAENDFAFELFPVPVDEDRLTEEYTGPLDRLGEYLARVKAEAAEKALLSSGKRGLVLAADTTVLLEGESLAKPRDLEEGERMLRALRGHEHIVATGVALAKPDAAGQLISGTAATRVLMRNYGDEEISSYVATGDSLDKAGGYSILHPGFSPVARIAGCHLGVVGLPVCMVASLLGRGPLPGDATGQECAPGYCCPWSPLCSPPLPVAANLTLPGLRTE